MKHFELKFWHVFVAFVGVWTLVVYLIGSAIESIDWVGLVQKLGAAWRGQ